MCKEVLTQTKKINENLSIVTERAENELLHELNGELSGDGEIENDTQNEDGHLSVDGAVVRLTSKESQETDILANIAQDLNARQQT